MTQNLAIITSFGILIGIIGIWLLRKKIEHSLLEKSFRILVTLGFLASLPFLTEIKAGLGVKLVYLTIWILALILIWKRPLFCKHCSHLMVRTITPKFCEKCGKKVDRVDKLF